jgi:thymidylate synthase
MISESSINKCWEEAMKYYLNNAYSRNICGKEYMLLDNLTVQASDYVLESTLSTFCPWRKKSREYYLSQITSPGKHSEINRLYFFGPSQINQYEYAINTIKNRKNIKPIVIPIYDPYKDNREHVPTPCISNIILDARDGVVNMYVNYSTMNLFRIGLLDYHQMAYLHQTIANASCKEVGFLRIFSVQIHMPIFDYIVSKQQDIVFRQSGISIY